jgi:delta(3,5)-delta(2,4)-dienoyl-CoA isomerase
LPKVVGSFGWVKEVALTARIFGAEEALRVGFVNRVFESKEAAVQGALEMAALMATKSPVAVQGTKEILNYSRDHSVQDGKCSTPPHSSTRD